MGTRLRCLLVEDSESDARLVVRLLERAGYDVSYERVETAGQMRVALEAQVWDAVLADYSLPEFNAPAALAFLQQTGLDLPFIVISGTMGEEAAVAMMKAGAHDYLMKDNLTRLGHAIERGLQDAAARRERRRAEVALRQSEARALLLADMLEHSSQPFAVIYPDGRMGMVNAAFCDLIGHSQEELQTLNWATSLTPAEWRDLDAARRAEVGDAGMPLRWEQELVRGSGWRILVELFVHLVRDSAGAPSYYYAFITDLTERKRAEAQLRESNETVARQFNELEAIYAGAPVGLYVLDAELRYLRLNERLAEMNGLPVTEHIGRTVQEVLPELSGQIEPLMRSVIETGEPVVERQVHGSTCAQPGAGRDWLITYYPIKDGDRVVGINGVVQEITDLKRAQQALLESEERFRQVAEDAGVFVWEVDADGLYTYASPVAEVLLGYTPADLIGKLHYYDLFAPDQREGLKAIVDEAFLQHRSFSSFLTPCVGKDGTIVILETCGTPMLDAAGGLLGYRGTERDVTSHARVIEELRQHQDHLEELVRERTAELKEKNSKLADEVLGRTLAVEAHRRSEARLQSQLDCMPSACITLGPDFRIRSWNPAAEQIFGFSLKEAVGSAALDLLVPEEIRPEILALFEKTVSAGQTLHSANDNLTKDGTRITCEWTNTRMASNDGASVTMLCMAQDITSRKQAEDALRRKTEELENFNKAMIGRESRLIELKEEVNRLCAELGRPPAYPPIWSGDMP